MYSWIILIILLIIFTVLGTVIFGRIFGRGEITPPPEPGVAAANNAAAIASGNPTDVRFEIVHRGYKPEQVDAVIDQLLTQMEESPTQKTLD